MTRLLQDSLGGNAKTVMIANIGPARKNAEETIGTLRWAGRAKLIKNKPKINEDPKDALIRQFQEEIQKLKDELANKGGNIDSNIQIEQIVQGVDPELLNQIKSEKEEQVMKILQEKGIVEAVIFPLAVDLKEAKRIADQLREFQEKEAKERESKAALTAKLQALQSNIVIGGENLLDKTQQQEQRLKLQAQELEQKQVRLHVFINNVNSWKLRDWKEN